MLRLLNRTIGVMLLLPIRQTNCARRLRLVVLADQTGAQPRSKSQCDTAPRCLPISELPARAGKLGWTKLCASTYPATRQRNSFIRGRIGQGLAFDRPSPHHPRREPVLRAAHSSHTTPLNSAPGPRGGPSRQHCQTRAPRTKDHEDTSDLCRTTCRPVCVS
jgi:hypothetical protein